MTSVSTQFSQWQAPQNFTTLHTLDCHTGGEPLRIVTDGFPELKGNTVLEKRRYCKTHYDHLRTALMFEPRGHADMYGAIVLPPEREDSHFGAIFIHNEGYSSMCGHATIALTKFAVEAGIVAKTGAVTQVKIDVPCGQINAFAYGDGDGDSIDKVTFECVPSYVVYQDQSIHVEGIGQVNFDVAFGGAYYAYVDATQLGLKCNAHDYNQLIDYGRKIKAAVSEKFPITHPYEPDLSFLYGTIFIEPSEQPGIHSRNVCVFADGEVDRSPTGSGVSGRVALHFAKQEVPLNHPIIIESILGSQFQVEANRIQAFGEHQAVIPRVTGNAFITGKSELIIDPNDPLKAGFILR
ncbi:proline racemase family protein [Thalassotalea atypica]|uniref:proline racemase family protein n=1 Tax=Thalassotalea atypica TaxID=2054316 RepID=UPI0025722821|nr:proline racemase family protein [Thalassotalea atypica]